jgi:hypothetical protein
MNIYNWKDCIQDRHKWKKIVENAKTFNEEEEEEEEEEESYKISVLWRVNGDWTQFYYYVTKITKHATLPKAAYSLTVITHTTSYSPTFYPVSVTHTSDVCAATMMVLFEAENYV